MEDEEHEVLESRGIIQLTSEQNEFFKKHLEAKEFFNNFFTKEQD
jgi:hypothetical protein